MLIKKIQNLNTKQWYVLRVTQEGALKWATFLNTKFASGNLAIVNTIDTVTTDKDEIRNRDVIFHINATGKELEGIKYVMSDFIVNCKELA